MTFTKQYETTESMHPLVSQDYVYEALVWINFIIDALLIATDSFMLAWYLLNIDIYILGGIFIGRIVTAIGRLLYEIIASFI